MDSRAEIRRERDAARGHIIYYAQRISDGMIKIGYAGGLKGRLESLEREFGEIRLLLTHSGWTGEKRALLERFAGCRAANTDWFEPALPLLRWICKTRQTTKYRLTQRPGVVPLKEVEKLVILKGACPALAESFYRDLLAEQVGGRIEVALPFGRCDVMTDRTVWEVEPVDRWRHGVAQALQYAAQVPQRGAIAVYGNDVPLTEIRRAVDALPPPGIDIWWLAGGRWVRA